MPTARDFYGEEHEVHPDGTFLWTRGGLIVRVNGDDGRNIEIVVPGNLGNPVGYVFTNRSGPWSDTWLGNDWFRVVTPCDCPRHQGEPTFHDIPDAGSYRGF